MKKLILLAVTTLGLFSCSNENNEPTEPSTRNVVVQFASSSLTRSVGDAVTGSTKAAISDYTIFFLDAAGNVVEGTKTGGSAPGSDAVVCDNVGKSAVSVYIVANTGSSYANIDLSGITLANKSTLADIKAKYTGMDKQQVIGSVVLANSGEADNGKIIVTTVDGVTTYAASVEVSPVVCRLEIGQICGIGGASGITGFKLEGIYIDGHAVNFNIGGGFDTANTTGANIANGIYSIGVNNSLLTDYPASFRDVPASPTPATLSGSDYVVTPGASKVWSYQLAAGAAMPKIIVKLSGVNGVTATKYVTVNSYKSGGAAYTTLVPGKVYTIDKISFETSSTAEVPNATEKKVSVTVTIKAWEVVSLTPEV